MLKIGGIHLLSDGLGPAGCSWLENACIFITLLLLSISTTAMLILALKLYFEAYSSPFAAQFSPLYLFALSKTWSRDEVSQIPRLQRLVTQNNAHVEMKCG